MVDRARCWYCGLSLPAADALIDLPAGKVVCRECADYNQALRIANDTEPGRSVM